MDERYIVIGTSRATLECIKALLDSKKSIVGVFSLPKGKLPDNSIDLSYCQKEYGIPYFEVEDLNTTSSEEVIAKLNPDYIISTWPKIISKKIISIPKKLIGTHPTPLPFNKGRHPLHWMIVLGIPNSVVTFFEMDEGIDSGKILLQIPFQIGLGQIYDLVMRMNKAIYDGVVKLAKILEENPNFSGYQQNRNEGNYWRKRTEDDVTLDPRMTSSMIKRIVRSFSSPYPNANLYYKQNLYIKIENAEEVEEMHLPANWQNLEHGQVLSVTNAFLDLKVDGSVVRLFYMNQFEEMLKDVKRIYPPTYYLR
ncbi:formyltransferase family protein [Leptospira weilii]|uniref:Formyl transferase domain protein n=1 Tax=Leptospira weilii str. UI 13098 TaxID=1088542 RepID=M6Q614_9LEPT|nr:formyltransferase family protein [Leptospira weilii]EMN90749.1 formyl transferase domain protein [Leptospira weilii str. UI 13098]OMI16289.1 methionyl-tRNA formyltransferase [Leptospira weilii serovar Heyan]ULH30103.1 methionyl-tRNA formyltransferase [Leptospira weilii]UPY78313.1 methionyl-tRNA formyltransferase [Leptospira weilii]